MSGAEEVRFSMKVMINKEKTKVLFAVVDNNFADILLSFMTLPLGVILRLLRKQYKDHETSVIGSFNTLYNGLANLDSVHFWTEAGKLMLLYPRSSFDIECRKLKLNIDDTQPIKYFACEDRGCMNVRSNINMYYDTARCSCKKLSNREIALKYESNSSSSDGDGEVFTVKTVSFLISDDLRILPNLSGSIIQSLINLGITDTDGAEQRTLTVGFDEIMGSLLSRTPLTDLVLGKRQMHQSATAKSEPYNILPHTKKVANSSSSKMMVVRAMVQKSSKKLLFVQAKEDFIDFLFSFLTIPLGQVECLLGGNTCLGSIDNLYGSIANMNCDEYFKSQNTKELLVEPTLPPKFLSKNQMFCLTEQRTPTLFYDRDEHNKTDSLCAYYTRWGSVSIKDPKGEGSSYVKGPGMFMVTDDLTVTPLCMLSGLFTLETLNIPLSDVEELEFNIGFEEGSSILKAALTSTYALTNGLINPFLMKQPKKEH